MKEIFLLILLLFCLNLFSQNDELECDTILIEGRYRGRNIFVTNPIDSNQNKNEYACKKVIINGKVQALDINQPEFEIILKDRIIGEKLIIKIAHISGTKPKVSSPN